MKQGLDKRIRLASDSSNPLILQAE